MGRRPGKGSGGGEKRVARLLLLFCFRSLRVLFMAVTVGERQGWGLQSCRRRACTQRHFSSGALIARGQGVMDGGRGAEESGTRNLETRPTVVLSGRLRHD